MPMEYHPNKLPKLPEWGTYCPDRSPQFKMHKQRNHAFNAIRNQYILFRIVGGDWQEVCRRDDEVFPDNCERCGKQTVEIRTYGGRNEWTVRSNLGDYVWFPDGIITVKYLCRDCKRASYDGKEKNWAKFAWNYHS